MSILEGSRSKTRALRDTSLWEYTRHHGLPLGHAAMVSILAKGEAINEIVRQHGASKDSANLPTAYALDLPTSNNVSDARNRLMQWRHSMHQEFSGLLQAGTFVPAPLYIAVSRKQRDRCHVGVHGGNLMNMDGWLKLSQG